MMLHACAVPLVTVFLLSFACAVEIMKYYVVFVGRNPGIYTSWMDCNREVCGFQGNLHQSYATWEQATQALTDYQAGTTKKIAAATEAGVTATHVKDTAIGNKMNQAIQRKAHVAHYPIISCTDSSYPTVPEMKWQIVCPHYVRHIPLCDPDSVKHLINLENN